MNKLEILKMLREIFDESDVWEDTFLRCSTVKTAIAVKLDLAETEPATIDVFEEMRQVNNSRADMLLAIIPTSMATGAGHVDCFEVLNLHHRRSEDYDDMIVACDQTPEKAWAKAVDKLQLGTKPKP